MHSRVGGPGPITAESMNPLLRLIATLAIVGVVGLASRSATPDAASAESVRCEIDPPGDVAGLEACVSLLPHDVELLLELGIAYDAAGRATDARGAYRRAVELDPRDADAQRRLAGPPR